MTSIPTIASKLTKRQAEFIRQGRWRDAPNVTSLVGLGVVGIQDDGRFYLTTTGEAPARDKIERVVDPNVKSGLCRRFPEYISR